MDWGRTRAFGMAVLAVLALGSGRAWGVLPDDPAVCTNCHFTQPQQWNATGGHADGQVDCVACHGDARPGHVGRNHRTTLACTRCHGGDDAQGGHPVRNDRVPVSTKNCLKCHDPHGSTNAQLIRPQIRTHGRFRPVTFTDAGGAVPGGFVNPAAPGTGLCEICHRKTEFYRSDGSGAPHYTTDCTQCHDHTKGFAINLTDQSCVNCHGTESQNFQIPSAHSDRFTCVACHAEVEPTPGPGHRAVQSCQSCHPDNATHAPQGASLPCSQCHDPHGTVNADLVLATITTPSGAAKPIVFDNIDGLADGSFASPTDPGSGICEICHTTTKFYRADGTGEAHYTFSCLPCHPHSNGFAPIPTATTP